MARMRRGMRRPFADFFVILRLSVIYGFRIRRALRQALIFPTRGSGKNFQDSALITPASCAAVPKHLKAIGSGAFPDRKHASAMPRPRNESRTPRSPLESLEDWLSQGRTSR